MSIITILKSIVAQLDSSPELTFIHGDEGVQNLTSDDAVFPAVYLEEPLKFGLNLPQSGLIQAVYHLVLIFANKTMLDATADEQRVVVDEMKNYMDDFVSLLQNDSGVYIVENAEGLEFTNLFDVNVSGIMLTIDVIPFNTRDICV